MASSKTDETPPEPSESPRPDAEGWRERRALDAAQAERLLDWLEAHGCAEREVRYGAEGGFTVRWKS
jgi:hypothetical protein